MYLVCNDLDSGFNRLSRATVKAHKEKGVYIEYKEGVGGGNFFATWVLAMAQTLLRHPIAYQTEFKLTAGFMKPLWPAFVPAPSSFPQRLPHSVYSAPGPWLCISRPGVLSFHCCVLSASRSAWCLAGAQQISSVGIDQKLGVWEALEGFSFPTTRRVLS